MENEYCTKHLYVPVNKHQSVLSNNLVPSTIPSGSGQSFFDPYDLSSDDGAYLPPANVAESSPGQINHASCIVTTALLCLNSPPEAPKNWGHIYQNLNDYYSDPMESSSSFWIPDITDWWRLQEDTNSKYADLSNMARDIFSILPHVFGVEACFSLGWGVIGCRQSKTTGETLPKTVVVRQFAWASTWISAGDDPALDTTITLNDTEMKNEM